MLKKTLILVFFLSVSLHAKSAELAVIEKSLAVMGVPPKALNKAVDYINKNKSKVKNKRYITFINYGKHSNDERLFLVDLVTGEIEKYLVSHGKKSDTDENGLAEEFSNIIGSNQTSLGLYLTATTYYSNKNGVSLILNGLEKSNNNAKVRHIVLHGADYVSPEEIPLGMSEGCPAVERKYTKAIIKKLKGGSLIYSFKEKPKVNLNLPAV